MIERTMAYQRLLASARCASHSGMPQQGTDRPPMDDPGV